MEYERVESRVHSFVQGIEIISFEDSLCCDGHIATSPSDHQISIGEKKLMLWDFSNDTNPLATRKSFRKEKRALMTEICRCFKKLDSTIYHLKHGEYEVETCTASHRQISFISPARRRSIVFQPFVFKKNKNKVGGLYLNISHTSRILEQNECLVQQNKTKKILTGMCLRPNVHALDANNNKIEMNFTRSISTQIIGFDTMSGFHLYETSFLEILHNLSPLFVTISQSSKPQLFFHLPLPEYLLYGVSLFLNGEITADVLDLYASLRKTRNRTKREVVKES